MTDHITPETMLPYLDGELPNSARKRIGRHLQSCWTCRRELERLQADIGMIVDAQDAIFLPGIAAPPPPRPWPRLEPRLAAKPIGFLPVRFLALGTLRGPLWASVVFGALACALTLVWLQPASVSADEVVRRASEIDAQRMQATPGHFVRQRVRVTKVDRGESRQQTGAVDSWRSARDAYWQFPHSDTAAADLQERYRRQGIAQHPLCVKSFQSWSRDLSAEGRVLRTAHVLDVSYAAAGQSGGSDLRNVTLRVLPEDWRITGMRLEFGDADFEIVEENVALFPRKGVPTDVLAHLEPAAPGVDGGALSAVGSGPLASPLRAAPALPAADEFRFEDIEMDVLFTLHHLGADLGEPITVGRGAAQEVVVQAWGASASRRDLLRRVLQDKPHVRLELEPPAGAPELVETKPLSLPRSPPGADRALRSANEESLVQWFGGAQAKEDFGRSVLVIATDMMVRFYALKALADRWPRTSERLSDDAKSQLRSMIQDHTRMAQQRCTELKLVMKPLLDEFARNEPALFPVPSTDWRDAASTGLKAAQEADLFLSSQFTTSDTVVSLVEALTGVRRAVAAVDTVLR